MSWDNMTWTEIRKAYVHLWLLIAVTVVLLFRNMVHSFCSHGSLTDFIILLLYLLLWVYAIGVNSSRKNQVFMKFSCGFWIVAFLAGILLIPSNYMLQIPPFTMFGFLHGILFWGLTYFPTKSVLAYILIPLLFACFVVNYYRKS